MKQKPATATLSLEDVITLLRAKARPDQLPGMARFGLVGEGRLGIFIPELRALARSIGKNHGLAADLWDTAIPEARILASMIDDPCSVTSSQMDVWAKDFTAWDVCDQVCMNLFDKSPHVWKKVRSWSRRKEEFVKRAAFALIACLAWRDKDASDEAFIDLLPIIEREAVDERNFVKKAVNWSLRHIGKRNENLRQHALATAARIQKMGSRTARWIALDATRELERYSPRVRKHR